MSPHTKRIKDLPQSKRPLEKLLEKGGQNVTDDELVALLLGSGRRGKNVLIIAKAILEKINIEKLETLTPETLMHTSGIGRMKAGRLLAAIELGKRIFHTQSVAIRLQSTQDILTQANDIVTKDQEYLLVFYVNARDEMLKREVIGIGSLNTAVIEPRDIFRVALQTPCAGIIICHNHPSGDPTPSEADIAFTKRIYQAGELLGVQVLDHVIVSKRGYFSFKEGK